MRPSQKREQIPVFEGMEPRLLLNGTVLATAVGTTLTITGDQADNEIQISQSTSGTPAVTTTLVTGVGGTTVVAKGTLTGIQSIIARMRGGDDSVVLTSALTLTGRFMFDGGPGNNSLEDALGVQASGGLTVTGSTTGTAANGDITIPGSIIPAAFATGTVGFVQTSGIASVGSIMINSVAGAFATGTITLASTPGTAAAGTASFNTNVVDGNIITLDDGVNTPIDFQAVDTLSTPAVPGEFLVGASATASTTAFVAAVNAAHAAGGFNITAQTAGTIAILTNTVVGTAGNAAIVLGGGAGAHVTVNGMTSGTDPTLSNLDPLATAGTQTVTLKDGVNTVIFTAVVAPAVPTANQFLIGASASVTLDHLNTAINAIAGGLTVTSAETIVGGSVTSLTITNDVHTVAGNQPITGTPGASWVLTNMTGGLADFANNDSVTLNDGQGNTVTFVGKTVLTVPAVNTEFLIGGTAAATVGNLAAKINAANLATPVRLNISAVGAVAIDEVQTLTASIPPTAGTFKITFAATSTADLAFGANAAAVDAALDAIVPGGVTVTGGPLATAPFVVTFNTAADVAALVVTSGAAALTGAGTAAVTVAVTETTKGLSAADAAKKILLTDTWTDITTAQASLGNVAITSTGVQWTTTGMAGGVDAKTTNVGDTVTLNDGVNPAVTFTAVASPVVGLAQFGTAITATQAATNFVNAVNGYTGGTSPVSKLLISAVSSGAVVTLTNDLTGVAGNHTTVLTFTAATTITATGLAGGADAALTQGLKAGDFVVIDDGVHPAVIFMAVAVVPGVVPVLTANEFAIGADAKASAANLQAAIAAFNQASLNVTATNIVDANTLNGKVHVVNNTAVVFLNHTLLATGHLDGGPVGTMSVTNVAATNGINMDGTTITLSDGTTTVTFTAKTVLSVPAVATEFQIGATAALTAANLIAVINASATLGITATVDPTDATAIILTADATGAAANVTIVTVGNGVSDVSGLSGGTGTGVLNAASLYVYLGNGTPNKVSSGDSYLNDSVEESFNGGGLVNLTGGTITGLMSITGGFGDDQVYLTNVNVGGKQFISLGSGDDTLSIVGGTVTGVVTLNTGTGDDEIAIDGSTFNGAVAIYAGLGDDAILIDPSASAVGTAFNGNLRVFGGGGADVITDSTETAYNAPVRGGVLSFIGVAKQGAILNDNGLLLGSHLIVRPTIQYLDGTGR
jgi:hypothetical protein